MNFGVMFLILVAFVLAILGFAAVLSYFLQDALSSKSSLEIDTPEEALERDIS